MRSNVVFTSKTVGYLFYFDADDDFFYKKTTDGGASWGSSVEIDTDTTIIGIAFDIWYDQWTPGDTGTLIHIAWITSDDADVNYVTLDTSTDTLGTQRLVFNGVSAAAGRGVFVSVTKTVSGYLYVAYDIDAGAEKGLHRSTDAGVNWSANLSTTFVEATLDQCLLFPAMNTGDGNDCWALYQDASADALTLKMWDSSAGAQTESATIQGHIENGTDLTGQIGFSATIRHRDGHLLIASILNRDAGAASHNVYDVTSVTSFLSLTAIEASTDDHYHPSIFIDNRNDAIYVAYNGARGGTETLGTSTKVYYVKSTNYGATWSAGDTAYMEGAAGAVVQTWAPPMGPRFYVNWRVGTTLVANAVNSIGFDVFDDVRQAIIDGIDSAQAEGTGWDALRSSIALSSVVRTDDRTVTITLPALATYDITATETLTATVPASALQTETSEVATPTFTIDPVAAGAALEGTATLSITAASALTTSIALTGAVSLTVTTASALTTAIRFAGASTVTITTTGDLSTVIRLAGAATASITATADLSTAISLAGAATVTLTGAGVVTFPGAALAGAATLSITSAGDLTTAIPLLGAATITVTTASVLSTTIALTGAATATLTATGALSTAIRLAGAADLTITAIGAMEGTGAALIGASTVTLTALGDLTTAIPLDGSATVTLTCLSDLTTAIQLVGAADLVVLAIGSMAPTVDPTVEVVIRVRADDVMIWVRPDDAVIRVRADDEMVIAA